MPLDQDATKEFKAKIKLAKSNPMNFAICLGKKPEDTAFLMDKKKPADLLIKTARKAPNVERAKSCCGTVSIEGSKMFLNCADDPPVGLVKKLKVLLKAHKLQMKPIVLTADGQEFEHEADDDAQGQEGGQQGAQEGGNDDVAEGLKERLKDIAARAEAVPEEALAQIQAGIKGAFQAIKAAEFEGASARLDQVEEWVREQLDAASSQEDEAPEVDPQVIAKWQAASAKLAPLVAEAVDRGVGEVRKIEAVWNLAAQKVAEGDYQSALKAAPALAKLISAARALEDEDSAEKQEAEAPGKSEADLKREFAAIKPDLVKLLGVVVPANKAALTDLAKSFGAEMKAGGAESSDQALAALKSKMAEIAEARAEGQRRRGPKLAQAKERAQALRDRLDRLSAQAGAA